MSSTYVYYNAIAEDLIEKFLLADKEKVSKKYCLCPTETRGKV